MSVPGDDEDLWRHEVEAAIRSWESTQLGDLKGKVRYKKKIPILVFD